MATSLIKDWSGRIQIHENSLWATFLILFPYAVVPESVFLPLPSASDASVVSIPLMCQTLATTTMKLQLLTNSFLFKGQYLCMGKSMAQCDSTVPIRRWVK